MNKPVSTILIFIITLMVAFLFAVPKYQESVDLQNSLMQKQVQYQGKSAYYAGVAELIKNVQARADVLDKIDNALPGRFSFAPLLYFFQQKGTESGLKIQSMAFSKIIKTDDQNPKTANFTVSVSGSYASLKKFLAHLDSSARLFEVSSISFASPLIATKLPIRQLADQPTIYNFEMEVGVHTY